MQSSDVPAKTPIPFGASATGSYIRAVPQTTADPAAASFDLGFPAQTFTDEGAGGTPPDGRDFNGILNFLSAWARWQSAGAPVIYDSAFQTAISGYPRGAVVASAATLGIFWLSTAENNVTNPDTGGAGWRRFALAGGLIGYRVISASATYTPTPGTASVEVIAIGAGGGGGGTAVMPGGSFAAGGGGGAGSVAVSYLTSGFSGAAIVIGAGGAGGVGVAGSAGAATTFGGSISAGGGNGGAYGVPTAGPSVQNGGTGGSPSGGDRYQTLGGGGTPAIAITNGNMVAGAGGSNAYGAGGSAIATNTGSGRDGAGPGGGGGGAVGQSGAGAQTGGSGAAGLVIIREYA